MVAYKRQGTGYTAQHTAQPHGAHSQEWPGPHCDPHTVGDVLEMENFWPPVAVFFYPMVAELVGQR